MRSHIFVVVPNLTKGYRDVEQQERKLVVRNLSEISFVRMTTRYVSGVYTDCMHTVRLVHSKYTRDLYFGKLAI